MINKQEIKQLIDNTPSKPKMSILLPTHRYGHQVNQGHDALNLKTNLKVARKHLQMEDWEEDKIEKFLRPARKLLDDDSFWSHQSDGLAIYLSDEMQQFHSLPVHFENMVYFQDEFYIKPLSSLIGSEIRFFILCLSRNEIEFYEATAHSITSIKIEDLVPMGMVEMDEEEPEKALQTHSVATGFPSMYHGQGANKDYKSIQLEKYLRAIDKGLMEMLHDERPPMIVAAVDEVFAAYKQINSYPQLMDSHVSGNPFPTDMASLQEKAWNQVKPHFEQERKTYVQSYNQLAHQQLTTTSIDVIMRAAIEGRVECLFTRDDRNLWGFYDKRDHLVNVHPLRASNSKCLLNKATIETLKNGGKTYNLPAKQMPVESSAPLAAILRY